MQVLYFMQILPISEESTRKINSLITLFIYGQEENFFFPYRLSTFRQPKAVRHIDLPAKCHAVFISSCLIRLKKRDTLTAGWFNLLNTHFPIANPTGMRIIPKVLPTYDFIFTKSGEESCSRSLCSNFVL